MKKILLSILFVLVIAIAFISHNVFANEVNLNMHVENGILYWNPVLDSECRGYDVYIYDYYDVEIAHHETSQRLASSFRVFDILDSLKVDSGEYYIEINLKGLSGYDYCYFGYVSPYSKLEAPSNLRWEGNVAKWNSVSNADGYEIELYTSHTTLYNTYKVNGHDSTSKNFSSLADLGDGWYFKVKATSTIDYRTSAKNESPKKGTEYYVGIWPKTQTTGLKIKTFENGYISWNTAPGATGYTVKVYDEYDNCVLQHEEPSYHANFDLVSLLNKEKVDSGKLEVWITPKDATSYRDSIEIEYISPYRKLEAPSNLRWEGNVAKWNSVSNADGYWFALYDDDGDFFDWWEFSANTTQCDFASGEYIMPGEGWYFEVYAYSDGDYRESVSNESPTKPLPFTDIPAGSWYYESVKYVSERGLITGYNETTFGPFDNLKREQLVNILWRIAGKPDASTLPNKFTDVPNGQWYTDAIKWANANGIVNGYGGTTLFGRGDNIKRQDLAIMLSNFAKYCDCYIAPTGTLDKFSDKEKVSSYAVDALRWASENGIISGNANSDGTKTIEPLKNAKRCEAAVMLTRFCQNVIDYDYSLLR